MFTLQQLDAIESSLASGTRSVSYDGKSVTFATIDEMLRVRTIIRAALGLGPKSATVLLAHDRGFYSGSIIGDE